MEISADGLPVFGGAQLAVDTTVSLSHCDGSPHPRATNEDGCVAGGTSPEVEPEFVGPRRRVRLVVFAGEVGVRWSEENRRFLSLLARANRATHLAEEGLCRCP